MTAIRAMEFSQNIPAQDERCGRTRALLIIAIAPPNLVKTRASIKFSGRGVVFVDFKENRPASGTGKTPQMQIEQAARQSASAFPRRNGDRQDFGFVRRKARQNEARQPAARCRTMRDHAAFGKQPFELAVRPAAMKRCCMQRRECCRVADVRFR